MSSPENPPEKPENPKQKANAETERPDRVAAGSSGPLNGENDAYSSLAESQSLFSQRSGIRDPLTRSALSREPEGDVAEDARTAADLPLGSTDSSDLEDEVNPSPLRRKDMSKKKRGKVASTQRKPKSQLELVQDQQLDSLRSRRKKKKLRVFYGRIKLVLKLCFAILWGLLLYQLVQSLFWRLDAPRFELTDAHLIQKAQLAPLIQPWVGKPLYEINVGVLSEKIRRQYGVIDYVAVRRRLFPARLDILVTEKLPWAEIYSAEAFKSLMGKAALADSSQANADQADTKSAGVSPDKASKAPVRPYGLIAGDTLISLANYRYQPGLYSGRTVEKVVLTPSHPYALSYLRDIRQIAWQARQINGLHLSAVDARDPNLVTLHFQEMPVILGRMNANADDRLARLIPLIPKIKELRNDIQAVDLRWEKQVTFHKKPASTIDRPAPDTIE